MKKFLVKPAIKAQILITGGLGFIGSHLAKKLIDKNFFLIIIDDLTNANLKILKNLPKDSFYLIKADINDKKKVINEMKEYNPSILVHLAAIHYIPYCLKNPKKTNRTNVAGTENAIEIAKIKGINKFIFSSSAAVYKPSDKEHKESSKVLPIDVYGKSKLKAEEKIRECCPKNKIKYVILRFFNIYGSNDLTPHFIPSILKKIKNSNTIKLGNLKTARDYLHVDDLVNALIKIIERKELNNEIYNVGTGKSTTGNEIIEIVSKIKETDIRIDSDKNLIRKTDRKKLVANIQKLSVYCGWKPKYSISRGLRELIESSE